MAGSLGSREIQYRSKGSSIHQSMGFNDCRCCSAVQCEPTATLRPVADSFTHSLLPLGSSNYLVLAPKILALLVAGLVLTSQRLTPPRSTFPLADRPPLGLSITGLLFPTVHFAPLLCCQNTPTTASHLQFCGDSHPSSSVLILSYVPSLSIYRTTHTPKSRIVSSILKAKLRRSFPCCSHAVSHKTCAYPPPSSPSARSSSCLMSISLCITVM